MNPPNQILQEKVQQMPNSQLWPHQVLQNITWASAPAPPPQKKHDIVTALNVTQKEEEVLEKWGMHHPSGNNYTAFPTTLIAGLTLRI